MESSGFVASVEQAPSLGEGANSDSVGEEY